MNKNGKALLKTLHILSASLWLGASASIVLLQYLKGWSENAQQLAALNVNFSLLDYVLIIPGAVGSLLTGLWMCKTTSWGFTRYRWVIVKWVSTTFGILVGSALLGPWQMQMVKLSSRWGEAGINPNYDLVRTLFTVTGSLQLILLIILITISVRKPWGKRVAKQSQTSLQGQRTGIASKIVTGG